MLAVFNRELHAYFRSPTGYVFCAVYLVFSGIYFNSVLMSGQSSQFPQIYYGLLNVILLILPVLTMRMFSEERRQKTDQILITSPVSIFSLVMGKFLSALLIYTACVLFTLIYAIVFTFFADPGWALVFGNVFGAILFGAAFIAVGMFISSTTESQVIAAIISFFLGTIFILLDVIPVLITNETAVKVIAWISFVGRYTPFTKGLLDFSGITFFVSVTAMFIFFTMQSIEKRRWA